MVLAVLIYVPLLASCSARPLPLEAVIDEKTGMMSDHYLNWESHIVEVDGWQLATVRSDTPEVRRIYIEGDGRAFIDKGTPSGDPTPLNPVALHLMLSNNEAGTMYVARPCQWARGPECKDRQLWTDKRFTQAVVNKYVALVERESKGEPVELVGYSGGAWVALQVAARLPNVTRVITVAGNLMPEWVNKEHKVTTIPVAPYPPFKRMVPVVAYIGVEDKVVGSGVIPAFEAVTGLPVEVVEVLATHGTGWDGLRLP